MMIVRGLIFLTCLWWFPNLCHHGDMEPNIKGMVHLGLSEIRNLTKGAEKVFIELVNKVDNLLEKGISVLDEQNIVPTDMPVGDDIKPYHLPVYLLDTNNAYYYSLWVYSGDAYVLHAHPEHQAEVSHGECVFPQELEEADKDEKGGELFLGYYLRPRAWRYPGECGVWLAPIRIFAESEN